jgi:hypothetical protein
MTVEKTARDLGASSDCELRSWCWLFRKCLDVLAKAFGLANTTARPRIHPFK